MSFVKYICGIQRVSLQNILQEKGKFEEGENYCQTEACHCLLMIHHHRSAISRRIESLQSLVGLLQINYVIVLNYFK